MNRRDREFLAWLHQPLSLADLLALELAELRKSYEVQVHLDARVRASIDATIREVRRTPAPDPRPRQLVQTDDWPPITWPGGRRSTVDMMRVLTRV